MSERLTVIIDGSTTARVDQERVVGSCDNQSVETIITLVGTSKPPLDAVNITDINDARLKMWLQREIMDFFRSALKIKGPTSIQGI